MANIGAPKRIIEVEPERTPAPSKAPDRKDQPAPDPKVPAEK